MVGYAEFVGQEQLCARERGARIGVVQLADVFGARFRRVFEEARKYAEISRFRLRMAHAGAGATPSLHSDGTAPVFGTRTTCDASSSAASGIVKLIGTVRFPFKVGGDPSSRLRFFRPEGCRKTRAASAARAAADFVFNP